MICEVLSFVETELERDISLPSSLSNIHVSRGQIIVIVAEIPGVVSPALSSLPNIRSLALL